MKLHHFIFKEPFSLERVVYDYFYILDKELVIDYLGINKEAKLEGSKSPLNPGLISEMKGLISGKNLKNEEKYLGLEYKGEIDVPAENIVGIISVWNQYENLKLKEEKMRGYFSSAVKSLVDLIEKK